MCYPKCHSFHVIMSCLIVSVYNVHSGFRLRSIVTAHMNVLPNKTKNKQVSLYYQQKKGIIEGESLKTIDLHCLIPSKMSNLMIPDKSTSLLLCFHFHCLHETPSCELATYRSKSITHSWNTQSSKLCKVQTSNGKRDQSAWQQRRGEQRGLK